MYRAWLLIGPLTLSGAARGRGSAALMRCDEAADRCGAHLLNRGGPERVRWSGCGTHGRVYVIGWRHPDVLHVCCGLGLEAGQIAVVGCCCCYFSQVTQAWRCCHGCSWGMCVSVSDWLTERGLFSISLVLGANARCSLFHAH